MSHFEERDPRSGIAGLGDGAQLSERAIGIRPRSGSFRTERMPRLMALSA
jgi:hypothetical protein